MCRTISRKCSLLVCLEIAYKDGSESILTTYHTLCVIITLCQIGVINNK